MRGGAVVGGEGDGMEKMGRGRWGRKGLQCGYLPQIITYYIKKCVSQNSTRILEG